MMLNYLKEQTKQAHKNVEQIGLGKQILDHSISYDNYVHFLNQNYWSYKTIEDALLLNKYVLDEELQTFVSNIKSDALAEDLNRLTQDISYLPNKPLALSISSQSDAIGALYVIEGSMLGSMLLHKNLAQCPNLISVKKHSFYGQNPKEVLHRWREFSTLINKQKHDHKILEQACIAAQKSFEIFGHYYNHIPNHVDQLTLR